jgi:FkbM family methyltransferase
MKKKLKLIYNFLPFKKQIFLFAKILIRPKQKYFKHLYFKGFFKVKVNLYSNFYMFHTGHVEENEIFWGGLFSSWEQKSISLWSILTKDADVVFDIGANTGLYSLVSKSVNKQASVHAFEPIPMVFSILERNNIKNSYGIRCNQIGLSNYNGDAKIYLNRGEDFAYSVTVNENTLGHQNVDEVDIKLLTLKSYIENNNINKIDLMKIDVETHEAEVIEGMGEYLSKFKPTILIEILNDEVAEKLNPFFNNLNYLYFNIDDKNNLIRQTEKLTKSDFWNFLICDEKTALKLNLLK